jgi:hypothetical protein
MSDLLAGLVPIGQFAKNIGKCTRTVLRWMEPPDGLPYTRLGNQRLIHPPTARAWLMGRMRNDRHRRQKPSRSA